VRLYPLGSLDQKIPRKLLKWSIRYGIPLCRTPAKLRKFIILGNGYPDDKVIFMLSHRVNMSLQDMVSAGILKPSYTYKRALGVIEYLVRLFGIKESFDILFVLDQDNKIVEEIISDILDFLKRKFYLECTLDREMDRLFMYECRGGELSMNLLIAVNGLGLREKYCSHKIEEQIIEFAINMGVIKEPKKQICDPKRLWSRLDESAKERIFNLLLTVEENVLNKFFGQQISALKILSSI